jgi:membrane protease YdiL (CAAX protease family)
MEIKQDVGQKIANIFVAIGVSVLLVCILGVGFKLLFGEESRYPVFQKMPVTMNYLFYLCVMVPFLEELIFRHLPIYILKKTEIFNRNKWYFIALIGIIFGWMHGSIINVWCQGLVGIALGWVYIKNNYSYISSVCAHSLYNLLVAFIIPILIS